MRSRSSSVRACAPGSRLTSRSPCLATSSRPRTSAPGRTTRPSRQEANPTTSAPPGMPDLPDVSSPSPGPTRCTPAACTRPAAARRRASPLPHGHQANASGGSSSASGVSSSGSAGSQPATTTVGRGGPIGRTATCAAWFSPPRTIRPPAAPKPSRAARSASSGSATNVSPTVASATREPGPPVTATGRASTGSPSSPGPNSSSTVTPSARARPRATRSEGSEWPDSTADTACLVTPATPASCCWDRPRACRASRSRVPSGWELSVMSLPPPLPGGYLILTLRPGGPGPGRSPAGAPRAHTAPYDPGMKTQIIDVRTGSRETIRDITGECSEFASAASDGGDGLLRVFVPHATAGIALIELGARSDDDLLATLSSLLPADERWRHAHGSRGHGRSHVLPAFVPPYATVPVIGGRLALGTWQSIALVDLNVDNPDRRVRLSFLG